MEKSMEKARLVVQNRSRARFESFKKMSQVGISDKIICSVMGVSPATCFMYRKFDTFEDFSAYNKKAAERRQERNAIKEDAITHKVEDHRNGTIETFFNDLNTMSGDLAAEHTENLSNKIVDEAQVYDPLARKMISEMQSTIADLKERLTWIEGNAVIDTSHRNKINFTRR